MLDVIVNAVKPMHLREAALSEVRGVCFSLI